MTDRYARQTMLPEVGSGGQALLAAASVLVVGAGGLGCPVLQYLAGAGVGHMTIVDHDRVEESNLHRQPLYSMSDIGWVTALAARDALLRLNPATEVDAICKRLTPDNAEHLVSGADVVVDAADSFAATIVLNDTCQNQGRPLISASVIGLSGYVGGFCGGGPSYRAVFPEVPPGTASCATAGVLGTTVALLGSLQAQFALSLILGLQPSPLGRLVTFEAGRLAFGGFTFADAPEPAGITFPFITASAVNDDDVVIDLRSVVETPTSPFANALRVGVENIDEIVDRIPTTTRVVLCCRSGLRASRAARRLAERGLTDLAIVAMEFAPTNIAPIAATE